MDKNFDAGTDFIRFEELFTVVLPILSTEKQKVIQVSYDHRSCERNLSNCVYKLKKVATSTGFQPVTSRCRCDALTNLAMKPLTLVSDHFGRQNQTSF